MSTDQAQHDRPITVSSHQPTDQTPGALSQFPGPSGLHSTQDIGMDLDSDSDTDLVNRPTSVFDEEGELSDPDQDVTIADTDQVLSEKQTYQEIVHGIRSFMGWTHIPGITHILLQMITPSRHPNSSLWAGLVSSCPVTNGCVGKWINLMRILLKGTRQELQKPVVYERTSM